MTEETSNLEWYTVFLLLLIGKPQTLSF